MEDVGSETRYNCLSGWGAAANQTFCQEDPDGEFNSLEECENSGCGEPDNITPGAEEIICYRCQNNSPVANQFPGPNCPQGWTTDPDPCKPADSGGPGEIDPSKKVRSKINKIQPLREVKRMQKIAGIIKIK